jgi:hypothetical protein
MISRRRSDQDRCERVHVEMIGGPFDGARMILDVVREGPDEIRVLEARYTRTFPTLRASEVER